jgi:hypothetical protein
MLARTVAARIENRLISSAVIGEVCADRIRMDPSIGNSIPYVVAIFT